MKSIRTSISAAVALCALALTAQAADLPKTDVKVIGNFSTLIQTKTIEKPFWTEEIPRDSKGAISVSYNNLDVMGLKEQQIIRLSDSGVADFATTDISKLAGDDPTFEGCDLAGIATTVEMARKACLAWFPAMAEVMERKFNTKLLGLAPNPGIVFWCRTPIGSVRDLNGKKVRVFNRTLADFVTALGGTTVTTPFGEVAGALQRGVFDCALTSTLSGNTAGWPEVTEYLLPMPVGWSIYYQSVSLNSWKRFDPAVQAFFSSKFAELDNRLWKLGAEMYDEGVSCNTGVGSCTLGKKASMKLVPVSKSDEQLRAQLVQDVVLVNWGKRCGKPCAAKWNETVGPVVGLKIPLDKL